MSGNFYEIKNIYNYILPASERRCPEAAGSVGCVFGSTGMSVFQRVRETASDANWSTAPRRGFIAGTPSSTYNEIVSVAFNDLNHNYNHARHSRYDEMYNPYLGTFRQQKMYTSLAPSLCIQSGNRACSYQQTPHKSYKPKQGEWLVERDRNRSRRHSTGGYPIRATSEPPESPLYRRTYTVPVSTTRVDNYFLYWKGRACGLDYIAPFLAPPDWRPMEDRRYQRIYWAPEFLNITPSCRHATHFMLSAY